MKSNKIMVEVEKEFPYINMAFVRRIRCADSWGVFIPCSEDDEALITLHFGVGLDHNLGAGVVVPLDEEESAQLDEAQRDFEAAGGYGAIR